MLLLYVLKVVASMAQRRPRIDVPKLFKQELSNSAKTNDPTSATPNPCVSVDSGPSKLKNRCESCNKKLGLMGFTCRCGKVFCQVHLYPMVHSCQYDFKKADRQILPKQNPIASLVVGITSFLPAQINSTDLEGMKNFHLYYDEKK
ncbi:zinc finger protein [Theobroma cacao]|nr:zinc finger protein [Theobroma cacao]